MSSSITITRASSPDVSALCELLHILFSQEAEFKPDREAQQRGLSRIIGDPVTGAILVARVDLELAGMVNILFTISTALGERVAILEDMVVAPRFRGSGVGSKLMAHAIQSARDSGCKRITLLTDRANESAQRFYQRHGFARSAMIPMRLMLNE